MRFLKFLVVIVISIMLCAPVMASGTNDAKVIRGMDVVNPELELSEHCRVLDGVAYWIIGPIHSWMLEAFWKDIHVLKKMEIKKIVVYINSGGGDVFAGMGLADQIRLARQDGFEIIMNARGIIASAAVPVYLSGSKRIASKNTVFMVHPITLHKFFSSENLEDINRQQQMLQRLRDRYIKIVVAHSEISYEDMEAMLKATTWFDAETAVKLGMIDELQ